MLRRVPHNGDQDKPHKRLADPRRRDNVVDASDKVIRADGDDDRRDDQHGGRGDGAHAGLLDLVLGLGLDLNTALRDGHALVVAVEEVVVRAQLEEEVEDVEEQEDDGRAAREEEDGVVRVGLDAPLVVEDVVELVAALAEAGEAGEFGGEGVGG